MDHPPAEPGIGHNRPPIDPERLLIIEIDEIADLLTKQYAQLSKRNAALLTNALEFWHDHKDERGTLTIKDDDEMNKASELYNQLRDHAGDKGEVEATRAKVVLQPRKAVEAINAWFKNLRERQTRAMEVIDQAQRAYGQAQLAASRKAEAERKAAIEREAQALRDVAQAKIDEANRLAREAAEQARAAGADDEAVDAALVIEAKAEEIKESAAVDLEIADANLALAQHSASAPELTRQRSATGVTTSASQPWKWELVDKMELCKAIVAGSAPLDFVTTNDTVINASIKGKAGRRTCPGLNIFQGFGINRRSAR